MLAGEDQNGRIDVLLSSCSGEGAEVLMGRPRNCTNERRDCWIYLCVSSSSRRWRFVRVREHEREHVRRFYALQRELPPESEQACPHAKKEWPSSRIR